MLTPALALTATAALCLCSAVLPGKIARRTPTRKDAAFAATLFVAVWLFALCAYHRPGLFTGFDAFRFVTLVGFTAWAAGCLAAARCLRGTRWMLGVLAVVAVGTEAFIFNSSYFNTHSYEPFELTAYLDKSTPVPTTADGWAPNAVDGGTMHFVGLDRPIYNLQLENLQNDQTLVETKNDAFTIEIAASDEAHAKPISMGRWEVATHSGASRAVSLDLTGAVGELTLQFNGSGTPFVVYPVACTFTGITANAPRAFTFNTLRFAVFSLLLLALYALRPQSGLWHRAWARQDERDRIAVEVCVLVLGAFVLAVPFWSTFTSDIATATYNTAHWDGASPVSFSPNQHGALAHSLLNGRLDLMQDPPEALLALENPYDSSARTGMRNVGGYATFFEGNLWDTAFYNGRCYVYFGVIPCLLFQLPFEAVTGIQNLPYSFCMVVLGWLFLAGVFGMVSCAVRRWFPTAPTALYLLSALGIVLGSGVYSLLLRPFVYEYVILAGAAFLVLALWQWLAASLTPAAHRKTMLVHLALGSLFIAFVAGCRPPMVLFAVLAIPIFWRRTVTEKRLMTRAGAGEAVAFLLPAVPVAAGLMWYNAARFGSAFDFGVSYNLTLSDMTRYKPDVARLAPALFLTLLDPPRMQGTFPFFAGTAVRTNLVTALLSETFFGGFLAATPFVWALGLPLLGPGRQALRKKSGLCGAVLIALAGILSVTMLDSGLSGLQRRYRVDYAPVALFGAALCWLAAGCALQGRPGQLGATLRALLRTLMVGTVLWAAFYQFCLLFAAEPWLQGSNPKMYYDVSRMVQFWL